MKESFDFDKFEKVDKTISFVKANVYALFMLIPTVLCFILYAYIWDLSMNPFDIFTSPDFSSQRFFIDSFFCLLFIVVLVVLHELTHGLVLGSFCKNKHKSIKYGIDQKTLSPYCHCGEILTISQVRLGYAAPLFTTGILPFLIALLIGYFPLMFAGITLIVGAGGDYTIMLIIATEKKNAFAEDHPSLVGCVVYRPK
ncbi:MAG: DUF3267 domain-containing protein [Oscillospiraceae bacterium]|nr:DUF3267 domain-containing protein [Oscillospiraceae bacterium]